MRVLTSIRLVLLVTAAVLVGTMVPGWACVPQPLVVIDPSASGRAGSEVTVRGTALSGRVEVRWNAVDGPLLATGSGPELAAAVTIPAVPPGLYTVVVVEREPGGGLGSSGRAAFLVAGDQGPDGDEVAGGGEAASGNGTDAESERPAPVPLGGLVAGGAGLFAIGLVAGIALRGRSRRHTAPS